MRHKLSDRSLTDLVWQNSVVSGIFVATNWFDLKRALCYLKETKKKMRINSKPMFVLFVIELASKLTMEKILVNLFLYLYIYILSI